MKILRDSLTDESVAGSGSASTALHDPDLKPDVTPRERLRREAMALKKVNHPGVCGIVDMELDDTLRSSSLNSSRQDLKDDVAANGRYVATIWNAWPASSSKPPKPYMRPASSIATSNPPM